MSRHQFTLLLSQGWTGDICEPHNRVQLLLPPVLS
jgi:hypothetical protein